MVQKSLSLTLLVQGTAKSAPPLTSPLWIKKAIQKAIFLY
jgi:hypothetical protein